MVLGFGFVQSLFPSSCWERGHLCSLVMWNTVSQLTPNLQSNPSLWIVSRICFDNTAERFNCASLPRCSWIGSSDNGPSTEWSIKAATDDLMMIEGPCIRVGPPTSESCLRAKKHHHTGSPRLWFESFVKCHSGADVSCISLIIGQQGQRVGLTRCIVLILMANTGKSWLRILVEILLKNRGAVDESKEKIKLVYFPFFLSVSELNTQSRHDPHDYWSLPPVSWESNVQDKSSQIQGGMKREKK